MISKLKRERMPAELTVSTPEAVLNTIANFSEAAMLNKPTIKKYLTPSGKIIHITDYITFHEVGYFYEGTTWNRCVINEDYIKENPTHFQLIDND
jgi:hypothetical protein